MILSVILITMLQEQCQIAFFTDIWLLFCHIVCRMYLLELNKWSNQVRFLARFQLCTVHRCTNVNTVWVLFTLSSLNPTLILCSGTVGTVCTHSYQIVCLPITLYILCRETCQGDTVPGMSLWSLHEPNRIFGLFCLIISNIIFSKYCNVSKGLLRFTCKKLHNQLDT